MGSSRFTPAANVAGVAERMWKWVSTDGKSTWAAVMKRLGANAEPAVNTAKSVIPGLLHASSALRP
jgi:hypothetical protein